MNDMKTVDITTETQIKNDIEENDQIIVVSEGGVKRVRADGLVESMQATQLYGLFVKDGILYEGLPEEEDLEADG